MALYLIGLGLFDHKDITLRGLEALKTCKKAYLESYTSLLHCSKDELEKAFGIPIVVADREMVEQQTEMILSDAKTQDMAFLVVGDIFSATTHMDIFLQAKKAGIKTVCIHNASVLTAAGITGLELYKFGKTTSIAFSTDNWKPQTPYDVLKANQSQGFHTLCLLDIKMKEPKDPMHMEKGYNPPRFMTVQEGIHELLGIENERKEGIFTEDTLCIGCARLGSPAPIIHAGTARELLTMDFGGPLHCLIVPGKLHFVEEEALKYYSPSSRRR